MNGKIYLIKNNSNNKVYIGQTIQDVEKRFKQHMNLKTASKKQLIYKAVSKIGKENFDYEILKENISSYEELNQLEEFYIKHFNSLSPTGYNLCPGGQKWRRKPILSEKDEKIVIEMYSNNKSMRYIAECIKVSHSTVLETLKRNNINTRPKNINLPDKTSKITRDIIIDLYINKKLTIKKIAELLNVNEKTIRRAKKRYQL